MTPALARAGLHEGRVGRGIVSGEGVGRGLRGRWKRGGHNSRLARGTTRSSQMTARPTAWLIVVLATMSHLSIVASNARSRGAKSFASRRSSPAVVLVRVGQRVRHHLCQQP